MSFISAVTNAPYTNRIQLLLGGSVIGPFSQNGTLGTFDPRRDLQVYADGVLLTIKTFSYDSANSRYLLFMDQPFNLEGVIQIVHHAPSPTFKTSAGGGWGNLWGEGWGAFPTAAPVASFALIASFSPNGDINLSPQVSLAAVPSSTTIHASVLLLWDTINVPQIRITGNNGADYQPGGFDTGLIPTPGSGSFNVTGGFTQSITLTLRGYDVGGNPLPGLVPASVTVTLSYPQHWGAGWGGFWG